MKKTGPSRTTSEKRRKSHKRQSNLERGKAKWIKCIGVKWLDPRSFSSMTAMPDKPEFKCGKQAALKFTVTNILFLYSSLKMSSLVALEKLKTLRVFQYKLPWKAKGQIFSLSNMCSPRRATRSLSAGPLALEIVFYLLRMCSRWMKSFWLNT